MSSISDEPLADSSRARGLVLAAMEMSAEWPRSRGSQQGTAGGSIHYTIQLQKDLAGASRLFDIRQTGINRAT